MEAKELKDILKAHLHWLNEDCDGWEIMRANLRGADLRNADLRNADLRNANLKQADLRGANLAGANLENADLESADLRSTYLEDADLVCADLGGANLGYADLRGANLGGANLEYAILRHADLRGANLVDANLEDADLENADLRGTNLEGADLEGADLRDAYLRGANLSDKTLQEELPICCPEYGSFIGWKKAGGMGEYPVVIIKLQITEDAKRSSATGRKCRCSKAVVLGFETLDGKSSEITETRSRFDTTFIYRLGEIVEVKDFDEDRKNECASGIHFFITRQEAVDY